MKIETIKKHLKASKVSGRSSTVNHALASALAPFDTYDRAKVSEALGILGQESKNPLTCSYCGTVAATWDHIHNTTRNSEFSGYGHRLGNLLPCCRTCNESKGKQEWLVFLAKLTMEPKIFEVRKKNIENYINHYSVRDAIPDDSEAYTQYKALRLQIGVLLREADKLAEQIRVEELSRKNGSGK